MRPRAAITREDSTVQAMSFGGDVKLYLAPDERRAPPGAPKDGYASLGPNAPIAWPSSGAQVPVTGQLSPHAKAALKRMGITKD
jgi:hypothetical protein